MIYYAHSENNLGIKEPLEDHLRNTALLCAEHLRPIGQAHTGALIGALHDLGKASEDFQQVLAHRKVHVNHALPGAAAMLMLGLKGSMPELGAQIIAGHHTTLDLGASRMAESLIKGQCETDAEGKTPSLANAEQINKAFQTLLPVLSGFITKPDKPDTEILNTPISRMLFTRLLYSGLVDADYTATARHEKPEQFADYHPAGLNIEDAQSRLHALREEKRKNAPDTPLNAKRNRLFDECERAGQRAPGVYTLTAPTGLGKTLALMAFALEHARVHHKRRIIILLPFLSLIEQNAAEYRQIVPDLLESHSGEKPMQDNGDDDARRLLAERWDAPCIVTTTVGFFEPLFSCHAPACRRLHQIADSVIVLDEAQSLPPELLDATLSAVHTLTKHFGCTALFSTATQPPFNARKALAPIWQPQEIVSDPRSLFDSVRRVQYEWRLDEPTDIETLTDEAAALEQALIIVNTRRLAQQLTDALIERRGDEVYLISTDLCKAHRSAILKEVRQKLANGEPCLLVSTQCIEAGVDISFPVLYRALAPLESIIQAAGRCNRNGVSPDGRVIVFRFPDDVNAYPSGTHYKDAASCIPLIRKHHEIDCSDPEHIAEYYRMVYLHDGADKKALTDAIDGYDYEKTEKEYRMIDTYGVQVIVPYGEAYESLVSEAETKGLSPALMARAADYTVNVPEQEIKDHACRIHIMRRGQMEDTETYWYYLTDKTRYDTDRRGLIRDQESQPGIYIL